MVNNTNYKKIDYDRLFEHVSKIKIAIIVGIPRAGSEFFQSLLDGHSGILQLPGVIFFHEFWKEAVCREDINDLIEEFIWYRNGYELNISLFKSKYNKQERWDQLGENRDESFEVNVNEFKKHLSSVLKRREINCKNFFTGIHIAYGLATGVDILKTKLIVYDLHHQWKIKDFKKDFDNFFVVCNVRDPRNALVSVMEHWKRYEETTFTPIKLYSRLKRLFIESGYIKSVTNNFKTLKLEDLHMRSREVFNEFCAMFDIKFEQSMLRSTYHGKLWWGDKVSQRYLQGFNPNFYKENWRGKLTFYDNLIIDFLLAPRLKEYGYILKNNTDNLILWILIPFLILLPMKYEISIFLHNLRMKGFLYKMKSSGESLFFYLARLKLYFEYYFKRIGKKIFVADHFIKIKQVFLIL